MGGKAKERANTRASSSQQQEGAEGAEGGEAPAWALALNNTTISSLKAEFKTTIDNLEKNFTDLLTPLTTACADLRKEVDSLKTQVQHLEETVECQAGTLHYLLQCTQASRERQTQLEMRARDNDLIITGISESQGETGTDLRNKIITLLRDDMSVDMSNVSISACRRLRKQKRSSSDPRHVLVSLYAGKRDVMRCARNLRGRSDPVYIKESLPDEINSQRATLRHVMKHAITLGKRSTLVHDKVLIDGKAYTVNSLGDIPFDISGIATTVTENHVLFSGRISPFSNFHTSPNLFSVDNISFCSSEQYYQYHKAVSNKHYSIAAAIMNTNDPVSIKHSGDRVQVDDDWERKAPLVMETGVREKFLQNPDLAHILVNTGSRQFQECNRYDGYWGIGISLVDARSRVDHSQVKGENVMGNILNSVRTLLSSNP